MKISVVVPAYNEAQRIPPSLERIFAYMDAHHPDYEVVVADDGSTDGTAAAITQRFSTRAQLRVLSYGTNRGKGYAVRYAAARATGEVVLVSDADLSTPVEEVEKMLPLLQHGYDIVIGSRAHALAEIRERQPLYREWAGKLFNVLVRVLVMRSFRDTQCGFKLFRREPMLRVLQHLQIDGFAFDVELLALARAAGLRIAEVPVVWINSPSSRVRLGAAARAYADLLQIRCRARRLTARSQPAGDHAAAQPPTR